MDKYVLLQGKVYASLRSPAGAALGFRHLGNSPRVSLTLGGVLAQYAGNLDIDPSDPSHNRLSRSGSSTGVAMVEIDLEAINKDNLSLSLSGTSETVGVAEVLSHVIAGVGGQMFPLNHMNLTYAVVHGVGWAPEYTEGVDYEIDYKFGTITITPGGGLDTGIPFWVSYNSAQYDKINGFTAPSKHLWIRIEGLNGMQENSPIICDIFKVRINPVESMSLIADDQTKLALKGRILMDYLDPLDTTNTRALRFMQV